MAAHEPEVIIDAEFVVDEPKAGVPSTETPADVAISASRRLADSFHRIGLDGVAAKASAAAEVTSMAQETYRAVQPGIRAIGSFFDRLEEMGILVPNTRPPLKRPK